MAVKITSAFGFAPWVTKPWAKAAPVSAERGALIADRGCPRSMPIPSHTR
jgi:hypothetical protein